MPFVMLIIVTSNFLKRQARRNTLTIPFLFLSVTMVLRAMPAICSPGPGPNRALPVSMCRCYFIHPGDCSQKKLGIFLRKLIFFQRLLHLQEFPITILRLEETF